MASTTGSTTTTPGAPVARGTRIRFRVAALATTLAMVTYLDWGVDGHDRAHRHEGVAAHAVTDWVDFQLVCPGLRDLRDPDRKMG